MTTDEIKDARMQVAVVLERAKQDYNAIFIGAKDVAEYMRCSVTEARRIMSRKDFPAVKIGKAYKVMRSALTKWAEERRTV